MTGEHAIARPRTPRLVTAEMVRNAHRTGITVVPWTVDDPATMHKLIDDGVDGWLSSSDRFGTVRIRATAADGGPVFIGIAPESAIDSWLGPVAHDEVRSITGGTVTYVRRDGQQPAIAPTAQTFWSASASGRDASGSVTRW